MLCSQPPSQYEGRAQDDALVRFDHRFRNPILPNLEHGLASDSLESYCWRASRPRRRSKDVWQIHALNVWAHAGAGQDWLVWKWLFLKHRKLVLYTWFGQWRDRSMSGWRFTYCYKGELGRIYQPGFEAYSDESRNSDGALPQRCLLRGW